MANVLIPKKSSIVGRIPTSLSLALGEIAINHADAKLYARHPVSGTVQEIGGGSSGAAGATVSDTAPSSPSTGNIWLNSATSALFVYFDSAWVEVSQAYFAPTSRASRSQWVSPYQYLGFATAGTAESTATWTIYRDEISSSGTVTAKLSATGSSWSNRATLSYT